MPEAPIPKTPPANAPSQIQTATPFVAFNPSNVPPSQANYFQLNDFILLRFIANGAYNFNFNYRYLTPNGEIKEGSQPLITAAGAITIAEIPLGEAWLLSFAAVTTNSLNLSAWIHLQVGIARGASTPFSPAFQGLIWQGYVYNVGANGFPGTPGKESFDGAGLPRIILGTAPGAGAEISELVPSFRRWQLLSLRATLTTSAAVANRIPQFNVTDGVSSVFLRGPAAAQVASTTVLYLLTPGPQSLVDANGNTTIPAPNNTQVVSSQQIRTNTIALQAGDQWTAPTYEILEWGEYNG